MCRVLSSIIIVIIAGNVFADTNKSDYPYVPMPKSIKPELSMKHSIIPQPKSIEALKGTTSLFSLKSIGVQDNSLLSIAAAVSDYLYKISGNKPSVTIGTRGDIIFTYSPQAPGAEYTLSVNGTVTISGRSQYEIANGAATLLHLTGADGKIPNVSIHDSPDSRFRGVEVDLGRKHVSLSTVKELVDVCFLYKMNNMILHLTDDQRFVFPSTAFPKLASKNAFSIEELKELEAYAAARGVYITPELDVPGHCSVLRNQYPETFKSKQGRLDVESPECREGLKTLIKEMCDVFQSTPYFHLGCDEAHPATTGEKFIRFITEMNDYIKSRNKHTIIWNGTGEAIPDDIIVIIWNQINPTQYIEKGHPIINGNSWPFYMGRHYPASEPISMQSLEQIYEWSTFKYCNERNPITIPPTNQVLGAMVVMWEQPDYLVIPQFRNRIAAISCLVWNREGETDFTDFSDRLPPANRILEKMLYPVTIQATDLANDYWKVTKQFSKPEITVTLSSGLPGEIRYTTKETQDPLPWGEYDAVFPTASATLYTNPITIDKNTIVRAALFQEGQQVGAATRICFEKVKQDRSNVTFDRPITTSACIIDEFAPQRAVDGIVEKNSFWLSAPTPQWITIDLEDVYALNKITVHETWLSAQHLAKYTLEGSTDGTNYTMIADYSDNKNPVGTDAGYIHTFSDRPVRYIKLTCKGGNFPGEPNSTFITEVKAYGPNSERPVLDEYNGKTVETKRPKLSWQPVSGDRGTRKYKVQVSKSTSFEKSIEKVTQNTEFVPSANLTPGTWYWRVVSDLNVKNYSGIDSFNIKGRSK